MVSPDSATPTADHRQEGIASILLGLCSVALRHLDPAEAVGAALAGGATGIEWEARVHVPPGDREKARRAAGLASDAGLTIPSYGSYVRAGSGTALVDFAASLASASELGTKLIRVWAGDTKGLTADNRGSAAALVADDLMAMCDMALDAEMSVSLEFHPGTFTETAASANGLIDRVGRPNLRSHWQPGYGQPLEEALASLQQMLPHLTHLHVFQWTADHTRLPLAGGKAYWQSLVSLAATAPTSTLPRYALVEFSRNDAPEDVVTDLLALDDILQSTRT
jgi:sugar phosphate isomerase/epimerase